ncbi:MAG: sterol desaturase family protein [Chitinophagales bacterium]|nr:sterol desaturase family protein [Chitinophagales bacterium]
MEAYAQVLNYAIPFFLVLILIEYIAGFRMGHHTLRLFDTISSLSSGITNVVKDVLGLSIVIISYQWMVSKLAVFHLESTWLLYVLAFIGIDFSGYWVHRWSHEVNVFWNRHVVHHSSEEFNLPCALRQSASDIVALFTFTYLPMALIGIPGKVIAVVAPIQLFAQFWYHTRLIGKMGWLEYILVTPSHHRVHHAINPMYLDKNYSQVFIVWDKWFGTFQPELPNEPAVYGITKAVKTWNPWIINYHHIWNIIKDAWRTSNWIDKIKVWFMPTGWRPQDVAEKYPMTYSEDIYHRPKYETESSTFFKIWSVVQLVMTLLFMLYLFNNIGTLPMQMVIGYGFFIFVSIFAYTSLMDGSFLGVVFEAIKCLIAFVLLSLNGYSWFGIEQYFLGGTYFVLGYLSLSLLLSFYFYLYERPKPIELMDFS